MSTPLYELTVIAGVALRDGQRAATIGDHGGTPVSDQAETIRLNKRLAQLGFCSRREADVFIAAGQVTVNGVVVTEMGTRVLASDQVALSDEAAESQRNKPTIIMNKPLGWVSGQPEDGYRAAVELVELDNLDPKHPWRPWGRGGPPAQWRRGLAPAGRLDIDSTGLLILTADGVIARQLVGQERRIDKEYVVRVSGHIGPEQLKRLRHGLSLDGKTLLPAKVEQLADDKLKLILREGRKRQVRRMCELVGLRVRSLVRTRIGRVKLGHLPRGKFRFLRPDERF